MVVGRRRHGSALDLWRLYPGPQGLEILGKTVVVAPRAPVLFSKQHQACFLLKNRLNVYFCLARFNHHWGAVALANVFNRFPSTCSTRFAGRRALLLPSCLLLPGSCLKVQGFAFFFFLAVIFFRTARPDVISLLQTPRLGCVWDMSRGVGGGGGGASECVQCPRTLFTLHSQPRKPWFK